MNYLLRVGVFFVLLFSQTSFGLGPLMTLFDTEKWDAEQVFLKAAEKSITDLVKRNEEAQKAQVLYKASLESTQKELAKLKEERQRAQGIEHEYTSKQIDILNTTSQVVSEIIAVYQRIQDILNDHIKLLKEHKEDPEFEKKGYQLEEKSIYSIEDFQKVNSAVLRHENNIKTFHEQLDKINADSERVRKSLSQLKQEIVDKKKEQAELKEQRSEGRIGRRKFTLKQQGALLDSEERLLNVERDLREARLLEADRKSEYLEQSIKITTLQLEMLQKQEDRVRRELRIDSKDIAAAEKALSEQITKSNRLQEEYGRRVESLRSIKQDELDKIKSVKERADFSDTILKEIFNWTYKSVSIKEWRGLIEIGRLNDHIQYEVGVRKDIYLAKIEQAKALVTDREVGNLIIHTWHNLSIGSFDGVTNALSKEQKKYEKIRADLKSSIATLEDDRAEASRLLKSNIQTVSSIKERLEEFKKQRGTVFKSDPIPYNQLGELLQDEAFVDSQKRSEYITQLIELYSGLIQQREMSIKKINTMVRVLESNTNSKLMPPLWNGVKKFIPDSMKFVKFLLLPGSFRKVLPT